MNCEISDNGIFEIFHKLYAYLYKKYLTFYNLKAFSRSFTKD